jgi:amino acid transporter
MEIAMTPQRIGGIVFLVLGIVLIVMGMNASNSIADQVTNTFTGHFTDRTTWFLLGGIGLAVTGAVITFMGFGARAKG